MCERYRRRDFGYLEVGRTYIANYSGVQVTIERSEKDLFVGDDRVFYTKTGKVKQSKVNDFNFVDRLADLVVICE